MVQFQSNRNPFDPATSPMDEEAKKIIDDLAVPYQKIGGRWPKERRFSRIIYVALIATLLGSGYSALFSSSVFNPPVVFVVFAWIGVPLLIAAVFSRKYNEVVLSSDERVFVSAYELIIELRQYPLPGDISDDASKLDYIIGELESNWTLG